MDASAGTCHHAGSRGYYWSSFLYENFSDVARYARFSSGDVLRSGDVRYFGSMVRPCMTVLFKLFRGASGHRSLALFFGTS